MHNQESKVRPRIARKHHCHSGGWDIPSLTAEGANLLAPATLRAVSDFQKLASAIDGVLHVQSHVDIYQAVYARLNFDGDAQDHLLEESPEG